MNNMLLSSSVSSVAKLRVLRGKFLISLLFLARLTQAQAQDVFSYPLESQTEKLFIETCSRISQHKFIKGNFEQEKIISRLDRSLKSSGNFIIASDIGMVWDTLKPYPSTMTFGADFMIQSRPGGKKTVIDAQGNEIFTHMASVLSAIFSGDSKKLIDNFEIFFLGSASSWEIGLVPIDKAVSSFAEKIIMKGDAAIRSIQLIEKNGDSIKYMFSNHNYPLELNANEKYFFSIP